MEIKIQCGCGTKYKFDVEPVNGRMPSPVSCPSCGANGTTDANQQIAQILSSRPYAVTAPAFIPTPPSPAATPAMAVAPPPPTFAASGLRVARASAVAEE